MTLGLEDRGGSGLGTSVPQLGLGTCPAGRSVLAPLAPAPCGPPIFPPLTQSPCDGLPSALQCGRCDRPVAMCLWPWKCDDEPHSLSAYRISSCFLRDTMCLLFEWRHRPAVIRGYDLGSNLPAFSALLTYVDTGRGRWGGGRYSPAAGAGALDRERVMKSTVCGGELN